MQSGSFMKMAAILGIALIGFGIGSLAYFMSPVRILIREAIGQRAINTVPLLLAALAIISGIALLLAVRSET